jgi:hypothetical protein
MTDTSPLYRQAARERFDTGEGDVVVCEGATVEVDNEREGAWVHAQLWVPRECFDPEPGPTYDVWISEPFSSDSDDWVPDISTLGWRWIHDRDFTCDDDPDGKGARAAAHEYARYLRKTYLCAFVAVRPAGKPPLSIHQSCE